MRGSTIRTGVHELCILGSVKDWQCRHVKCLRARCRCYTGQCRYVYTTAMPGGVDMCVCTRNSYFIPVVLLICCAVALLCLVCHTHRNEGGERIRIRLESSQDTVYLRSDHCCYRSRVIRMETDMETWLVRFIYRTPRKKGTGMDSTAPIYLVWNLIEDSLKWEYTLPTFHSSCTLRTSRFYSYEVTQATLINQWVQSRHGLHTARPFLLSLRGHSRGDRHGDVTSSLYI